ncbi:GNAT family N-acetyltransferase [Microbispora hainanensis]|jgi:RimJ/RimL family protein N-acetyltransferase|uniref:GNAT family N-acetyltransferase n=1 Tax=Microbispora hainanensis TaxID=568844 RepID=A0ABZ1SIQ2_9ACTN|nr:MULTISPECIES: GNAT family protein [Microbispora]NJP26620.1 GNAT family N-acetyltransferase [Microbispora sp. CL1-1]TQS12131.1 GNAT family N-acetyltransferase [Microbispora sp. SCL1-1]
MRHWPLLALRLTTPRLELRLPGLDDLDALADRAAEGVHDSGEMPFGEPWTDAPPHERARSTVQVHFRQWGTWSPGHWACSFVTVWESQVVGVQEMRAVDFAVTREVATGSWLGRRFHGKGIGTEMRAAVLHLAFAGLGARYARSSAFADNAASLAVSRKLGYREDGIGVFNRRGEAVVQQRVRLSRDEWRTPDGFEIHNLAPCLPLFGVAEGITDAGGAP